MTEPIITIFNDGKENYQSYEATVSIDLNINDQYEYAHSRGCSISAMLDFEQTEYGANELDALQNLNCSISYLIERLTLCRESVFKKIKEHTES